MNYPIFKFKDGKTLKVDAIHWGKKGVSIVTVENEQGEAECLFKMHFDTDKFDTTNRGIVEGELIFKEESIHA